MELTKDNIEKVNEKLMARTRIINFEAIVMAKLESLATDAHVKEGENHGGKNLS